MKRNVEESVVLNPTVHTRPQIRLGLTGLLLLAFLSGCGTTGVDNTAGQSTIYLDTESKGKVSGLGIEAQDISSMVDEMVRNMLANPAFANAKEPPRVIVDSQYFQNQSKQRIDKNLLINQLLADLHQAANSRILFVNREFIGMVEDERALKRAGVTDVGTTGLSQATAGADYRLSGRINSLEQHAADGVRESYTTILFQMTDLENGIMVWSNQYEIRKAGQDSIVYR
ncbi:MAG: penicillin-binding protein activator LpoB [Gammaproteobacteria bacterium]|nr:penicillin-binding protein activator LpoB [Gammaproteobacteria bacterium]